MATNATFNEDRALAADLERHQARLRHADDLAQQQEDTEMTLQQQFIHTVYTQPVTAKALFAPMYRNIRDNSWQHQNISDIFAQSLDYTNGPSIGDALAVIIEAAQRGQTSASTLINRCASTWARYSAE